MGSDHGPLESETTALPTQPQPLSKLWIFYPTLLSYNKSLGDTQAALLATSLKLNLAVVFLSW